MGDACATGARRLRCYICAHPVPLGAGRASFYTVRGTFEHARSPCTLLVCAGCELERALLQMIGYEVALRCNNKERFRVLAVNKFSPNVQ